MRSTVGVFYENGRTYWNETQRIITQENGVSQQHLTVAPSPLPPGSPSALATIILHPCDSASISVQTPAPKELNSIDEAS